MIERMLEAERALAVGLLDQAEKHYASVVAADPRNAIALVGLARVALERGDQVATYRYARRALALDPDNPAASHLVHRMSEQFAIRGEPLPADDEAPPPVVAAPPPGATAPTAAPATHKPSLLDRIRGRGRE
jgi:tetratricopeptide (TPR) repeat protein